MKLLVVDDENLVRRALVRAFQMRGHEVFEASSGAEGLQAWRQHSPEVLIVDVLMPGLTGPQMVSQGRAEGLGAKVLIFMSAFTGSEQLSKQDLGSHLFLPKPFEDIFKTVERVEALYGSR